MYKEKPEKWFADGGECRGLITNNGSVSSKFFSRILLNILILSDFCCFGVGKLPIG
jgi:hypothetical protein